MRRWAPLLLLSALSWGCPLAVSDDYEISDLKAAGESCKAASECSSAVCSAGKCAAPSCTDGVKNGNESDRDCGGSCPKCPDGRACKAPADCVSDNCAGGKCAPK